MFMLARIKEVTSIDRRWYSNRWKILFCMPQNDISSIFKVRFLPLLQKLLEWYIYCFSYFFSNEQFHKFMKHCKFWSCDSSAMFATLKWLLTFISFCEHQLKSLQEVSTQLLLQRPGFYVGLSLWCTLHVTETYFIIQSVISFLL